MTPIETIRRAIDQLASGTQDEYPPFRAFPVEYYRDIARQALPAVAALETELSAAKSTSDMEKLAAWMMANGFATGHGETLDDLLMELGGQVRELRENVK